jgi:S-adenosylmethionine:tRNA ribosyltransferase-isomerase
LPSLLRPGDLLVINESAVTSAALTCRKTTGGKVEILVVDPACAAERMDPTSPAVRTCMVKASKPVRAGSRIELDKGIDLVVEEVVEPGRVRVRFPVAASRLLQFLEDNGSPPLPPYIRPGSRDLQRDKQRYQTVYAMQPGSVAAPTAGLHFTPALMEQLNACGVEIARIVLHVGPGTFTPVRTEDIRLHGMESEFYEIPQQTAEMIAKAQKENRRVIAVGTTTVRTLESAAKGAGIVRAGRGITDLFIFPGYDFRVVKGMVTNFHLPGSTLLMLVSALGGLGLMLDAYQVAIKEKFLFYSYGDACLVID